jgi:hypothetical protein
VAAGSVAVVASVGASVTGGSVTTGASVLVGIVGASVSAGPHAAMSKLSTIKLTNILIGFNISFILR